MIKKLYFNLLKSISTIAICVILTLISIVSFIVSFNEKTSFVNQLSSPSADINIKALRELVEHYNGYRFLFDFWYVSDFNYIFIIALFLFIGVFLSYQLQKQKDEAFGNLIISRISYKKYLISTLISQSLYIFSIITVINLLSLFIAFIFGGFGQSTSLNGIVLNSMQAFLIVFAQNLFVSIIMILINACSLLFSSFIKNKYFLQAFPLFVFVIIPQLVNATLGNLSSFIGNLTLPFVLWNEFSAIDKIVTTYSLNGAFSVDEISYYMIPLIVYFILFIVLYYVNIKKNERDYI